MNVAVHPERRRSRDRHRTDRAAVRGGRAGRPLHARGAGLQWPRDHDVPALRLPLGGPAAPLLPRQRRGRPDHVAGGGASGLGRLRLPLEDPRPRDLLRRHLRGGRRGRADPSRTSSPRRRPSTSDYGGVVPEVASRHHLELVNAVVAAALDEADTSLAEMDAVAVTQGPGLIGALLVGLSTAKALAASAAQAADPRRPPPGARRGQLPRARPARAPVPLPDRERRPHPARRGPGARLVRDAGGDPRRRRRRGLRQGRPAARARLSGRARRSKRAAEGGDPEAFEFPVAMSGRGLDFSFSGLKTALVYRVRELGRGGGRARARRPRGVLPARDRRPARGEAGAGREVRRVERGGARRRRRRERRAPRAARSSSATRRLRLKLVPLELCTDNAAMIASAARFVEPIPYPDYLGSMPSRAPARRARLRSMW